MFLLKSFDKKKFCELFVVLIVQVTFYSFLVIVGTSYSSNVAVFIRQNVWFSQRIRLEINSLNTKQYILNFKNFNARLNIKKVKVKNICNKPESIQNCPIEDDF